MLILLLINFLFCDTLENNLEKIVLTYMANYDYKTAEKICKDFLINYPENCKGYELLSEIYLKQNDVGNAISINKKGIENNSECERLYFNLAEIYFQIGKYELASEFINKFESLQKFTIDKKTYFKTAGLIFFMLKDYTKAVKYFENYLKNDLFNIEIYELISKSYQNSSQYNLANSYKEIKNLIENKKFDNSNIFKFYAGTIFLKNNCYEKAEEYFKAIYEEMIDNIKLNFNFGLTYLLLNNSMQALDYIERAKRLYDKKYKYKKFFKRLLKTDSTGAKYTLVLALTYYLNTDYEKAENTFEEIKKYDKSLYNSFTIEDLKNKNSKLYKILPELFDAP